MKVPMTKNGHDRLREELARLKKVDRPKVVADIAEARAHGDLRENAEYAAAKEKQGFIEGRIRELETKIADAQVVDTTGLATDKVVFGATVHLMDMATDEEKKYMIVGVDEADLKAGKISVHSLVAKSLIGRAIGNTVKVVTPAKTVQYEILKIAFE